MTVRARISALPLWQVYLVVGALICALYVFVPPFAESGPVFNLLGLSPVIAILVGVRRYRPVSRSPWRWFALGFLLFWAGDLYTYSYPRLFHHEVPFPSIGDAAYLVVYPALMAGLLILVRRRNPERDRAGLIDSLIITLGLSLISWVALIQPTLHDDGLSTVAKLVSIAYPVGDILLLAAAIRLAVDTGARRPAFYLLASSIVALLATDFAYGLVTLAGAYDGQVWLDVGWISFYLLWGAAALHPSMAELERAAPDRDARLTPQRLVLLVCASLIAPVMALLQVIDNADDRLVVNVTAIVLFGLVVTRMAGLVRQQERSVARERILSAAGADLVAATSREDICHAALAAACELAGDGAAARLCLAEDGGFVAADAELAAAWPIEAGDRRRAARRRWTDRCPRARARGAPAAAGVALRPRAGALGARRDARAARDRGRAADPADAAEQPGRAGDRGLARARERGADRGGAPAHERGALRLAGPALQRPHHRARRGRVGRLPEPLDRARPRLHPRGGRGHPLHPAAAAGRGGPAPARAGRPRDARRRRDRGARVRHAPRRRQRPPVRGALHRPARRRERPRRRAQRPRRERAQGVRGAARAPGLPRPRHEPRQPRAVRGAGAPRAPARTARGRPAGRDLHGPRRLQDDQRQPRPRRRRRRAAGVRQAPRRTASARATPRRASAATSSPCCSRTSAAHRTPPTRPSGSSRRSPRRCGWRARSCSSAAASASRSPTARPRRAPTS